MHHNLAHIFIKGDGLCIMITTKESANVKITPMFCILMSVYAAVLLISNIISAKVIMPFGVVLPCAIILFPMVYILSDLMTEVYGLRLSMIAIKTNTILNLFMSAIFLLAVYIPSAPFYPNHEAFKAILGNTPRMVLASLLAYFGGDTINSIALSMFKGIFKDKKFLKTYFFRSIGSSMLGQIFDTGLFIFIAFVGTMPLSVLFTMMYSQYIIKIVYQIICFPIMHYIVQWWKNKEGMDVVITFTRKGVAL